MVILGTGYRGYGLSHICSWVCSLLEYDGTCSHNPMSELPASDCDLTAEELKKTQIDAVDSHFGTHRVTRCIDLATGALLIDAKG